jgi:hypothetical protein
MNYFFKISLKPVNLYTIHGYILEIVLFAITPNKQRPNKGYQRDPDLLLFVNLTFELEFLYHFKQINHCCCHGLQNLSIDNTRSDRTSWRFSKPSVRVLSRKLLNWKRLTVELRRFFLPVASWATDFFRFDIFFCQWRFGSSKAKKPQRWLWLIGDRREIWGCQNPKVCNCVSFSTSSERVRWAIGVVRLSF